MTFDCQIRNFCIISHIDHGKSTLADRFLEITRTVEARKMHEQFLDQMDLERERGITIKLQPVRMTYRFEGKDYVLNLIDTPGHVDFSYEVSRSLAAVEGAVLLVDATQGIQAQTLSNFYLAQKQNLVIIPVINKIDLPSARLKETEKELSRLCHKTEILKISAKQGTNVEQLLQEIIKKVPPPKYDLSKPFKSLIFDSKYDSFRGVIAYIRVSDGEIKKGEYLCSLATHASAEIIELGIFKPNFVPKLTLKAGEIGYIVTGFKSINQCQVGDTLVRRTEDFNKIKPLPGYKTPQPMVFVSLFPANANYYERLKQSLSKLKLNDASLTYEPDFVGALGRGFKCGFLGLLHLEITIERLKREFGLDLVVTNPSVGYRVTTNNGQKIIVRSATNWPLDVQIKSVEEPWIDLEIITPVRYLGQVMELLKLCRSQYQKTEYLSPERALVYYQVPLAEIIVDFYDKLKSVTSGYASMNYKICGYRTGDLVRMDVLIAGERIEALSRIVPRKKAYQSARNLVKRVKANLPRQLFAVSIQAAIGNQIIARETLSALRKDVTGYLYGGDYTRKMKLLEKQKRGKKKLKKIGKVNLPQETFIKILKERI